MGPELSNSGGEGNLRRTASKNRIGLKNTGIDQSDQVLSKRVKGYMFDAQAELVKATYVNMDIKIGGGSLYSSLRDLVTFTQSLVDDQLLQKASLDKLPNIQIRDTGKFFTANGRVQGYCHQITHRYEDGLTVIVLGNHYSNIALPISQALIQVYDGEQVEAPKNYLRQRKELAIDQLKPYLGTYDFGFGPIGEVEIKDRKLVYGNPGKANKDQLIPIGNHQFFYIQTWVILEFQDLRDGQFQTLNWVMGGNKYPATRMKER